MDNWIHVKDKLPEPKKIDGADIEYEDVLVVDRDGQMYVGYLQKWGISGYRTEEEYHWSERSTSCGCCAQDLKPTHWMPLPAPPPPWHKTESGQKQLLDLINKHYYVNADGDLTERET